MLAVVGYTIGMCNKILTLEDIAHEKIIVLFVVGRQGQNITENMYSCLLNCMPSKHTPCDMIRLLLKSTTTYVGPDYKLFEENPPSLFQITDN